MLAPSRRLTLRRRMRRLSLAVLLAPLGGACEDPVRPAGLTVPAAPLAPVPGVAPTLTAVEPNVGSTGGDTPIRIVGTGFQSGAVVRLGGVVMSWRKDHRDTLGTILYAETPPHDAGPVVVTVSNPDGQVAVGAYTYAPTTSFDFDGTWWGFGNAGQDLAIQVLITNGTVVSVSCDITTIVTFAQPLPVTNGEFSYTSADGFSVSGRVVSDGYAVGTINLPPCGDTHWTAAKYHPQPAARAVSPRVR